MAVRVRQVRAMFMYLGLLTMLRRHPVSGELVMECYPNGTMYVVNPDPAVYWVAYVEDSNSRCTAVFSADNTVITITDCAKDENILVQLSKAQPEGIVIIGDRSAFVGIIHCKEDGIVKDVRLGMAVTFTPTVQPTAIVTVPVDSYIRRDGPTGEIVTSGIIGSTFTWTIEVQDFYYIKFLSCMAYPGTEVSATLNAQLLNGRCSTNKLIVPDYNPTDVTVVNGYRIYYLGLTLFRFFSEPVLLIQCQLRICPAGGQGSCVMSEDCAGRRKRLASDPSEPSASVAELSRDSGLQGLAQARFRVFDSYQEFFDNGSCTVLLSYLAMVLSLLLFADACWLQTTL